MLSKKLHVEGTRLEDRTNTVEISLEWVKHRRQARDGSSNAFAAQF
ncbi:MAG: hypothetical protein ACRD51_16720 [Candidatus Acidiferrum sp.]